MIIYKKIFNKHWKYVEIQNFYKNSAANTSVLKVKKHQQHIKIFHK